VFFEPAERVRRLTPSMILEISAQASADPDVVNLSAGQPDFPTPDRIKRAGIRAIEENFTTYTAGAGIPELRRAVADRVSAETGIERVPEEVLISCGGKHAIANAILSITHPGDRVLLPTPYWVAYPEQIWIAQGEYILLPTEQENGFRLTPAQLEAALATDPKLIILNSPSNPTGAVYQKQDWDLLVPLLKESGVFIISDEIYDKLVYNGRQFVSLASYPEIKDQVILINGVSKTYSMTGWRIGWAVGHREIIRKMACLQSQMTSSPCSISQKAALEALRTPFSEIQPMLDTFQKRRRRAFELISKIPDIKCHPPEGTFYLFPDVSAYLPPMDPKVEKPRRSLALARYLVKEAKVAVVPGMAFGADDHIRISFAYGLEQIEEGINRLAKGLKAYLTLSEAEQERYAD
jgi:aspartate aminotransferase